jgi:DNA-directed RNA polymerase specialized sigma24 family protein
MTRSLQASGMPIGVQVVVAKYAARLWWVDRNDLEQEAALCVLENQHRWKEGKGRNRGSFLGLLVARHLIKYVARGHYANEISTVDPDSLQTSEVDGADRSRCGIEFHLDVARASREVRRLLADEDECAREVLLGEQKPSDVARSMGLDIRSVYRRTERARLALRGSHLLREQYEKGRRDAI